MLLTICALFPTLVHAASAEERPVEVNSEQKQAPPPEAKPELKPVAREAHLATKPTIQERSPKQAAKPIADPPMIRSLPTGENKTGVSSQSISVPKGPARSRAWARGEGGWIVVRWFASRAYRTSLPNASRPFSAEKTAVAAC
jgi:hypothetical protein